MVFKKIKTKITNKAKREFLKRMRKDLEKSLDDFKKGLEEDPRVKNDPQVREYYEKAIEKTEEFLNQIDRLLENKKVTTKEFRQFLLDLADMTEEICTNMGECDPSAAQQLREYASSIK